MAIAIFQFAYLQVGAAQVQNCHIRSLLPLRPQFVCANISFFCVWVNMFINFKVVHDGLDLLLVFLQDGY